MMYVGPVVMLLIGCGEWKMDADLDGDGVTKEAGDCWDNPIGPLGESGPGGAEIFPGATEAFYSGVDEDCDALTADGDQDGDGYWVVDYCAISGAQPPTGTVTTDCDDLDATVNPGISPDDDAWYDGIDQDCAGNDDFDQDYDGAPCTEAPDENGSCEGDCDDTDPQRYPDPNIPETWYDGIDQNCDGHSDYDQDFDGFDTVSVGGEDCNDESDTINPDADEDCSTTDDDDCNGETNQQDALNATVFYTDTDADTYGTGSGEAWCEPVGDLTATEDGDCDDTNTAINPGAQEICDALDTDEDCDGSADNDDNSADSAGFSTYYADNDSDFYGDAASTQDACDAPSGFVADNTDCADSDATINPGTQEICDSANTDEDCSGSADDADPNVDVSSYGSFYADLDGDGYGDAGTLVASCDPFAGAVTDGTDCDDGDIGVNPGATEVCDSSNTDEDCDGQADDDDSSATGKTSLYLDSDGDAFGAGSATGWCDAPGDYVADNTDCDDTNTAVNPAAQEVCDATNTDEDCSGSADDQDAGVLESSKIDYYEDGDGDGYGNPSASITQCDAPSGYGQDDQDCDDADPSISPGALEYCDGVDNNCVDGTDEASAVDVTSWYVDADHDGYGKSTGTAVVQCYAPSNYVSDKTDCNDSSSTINPAATEVCDSSNVDEDCDGNADDNDSTAPSNRTTFYRDNDSDGYGTNTTTQQKCDQPSGYVSVGNDCDDNTPTRSPGLTEICDSLNTDEDCDGNADDNDTVAPANRTTFYQDADNDSYGTSGTTSTKCDQPTGYVTNSTDCDDTLSTVKPGVAEQCSTAYDDDCDGLINDADSNVTGQSSWYIDADEDGQGDDGATGTVSCSQPSGKVANNTDCDDTDAYVYDGATEYCDGVANDCGSAGTWTSSDEADLVTYVNAAGDTYTAISSAVWPTSGTTVLTYTIPADGTINVCEGTYPVKLVALSASTATVKGIWGAATTTLDILGNSSVVTVGYTSGTVAQSVTIQGLTLTGGIGTGSSANGRVGGGAYVYAPTAQTSPQLTLKEVIITGNSATRGGGIMVGQSTGASNLYGNVRLQDSIVDDNDALVLGGSVYGGGIAIRSGTVTCVDSDITNNLAEHENANEGGGGVWLQETAASFSASSCYMGSAANSDNNSPSDVDGVQSNFGSAFTSDTNADTFTCTGAGCVR